MELRGKKVILLAEEMYNEYELWYPYYRLKEAGADVTLVGSGSAATASLYQVGTRRIVCAATHPWLNW